MTSTGPARHNRHGTEGPWHYRLILSFSYLYPLAIKAFVRRVPPREVNERDGAFALLDILVGLAILALALSVAFEGIGNGIQNTARAKRLADAVNFAESLLAKAGTEVALAENEFGGQSSGYLWTLSIRAFGDSADRQAWPIAAYEVTANVQWNEGLRKRTERLKTIRLGPKASTD